jgi:hypothetical protein
MAGGEAMGQEQLDLYTDYLLSTLQGEEPGCAIWQAAI